MISPQLFSLVSRRPPYKEPVGVGVGAGVGVGVDVGFPITLLTRLNTKAATTNIAIRIDKDFFI